MWGCATYKGVTEACFLQTACYESNAKHTVGCAGIGMGTTWAQKKKHTMWEKVAGGKDQTL